MKKSTLVLNGSFWLRVLQGALIGISGVLPGVSGGVFCILFGIYQPAMEVIASPKKSFKKHLPLLLPVCLGAGAGFLLLVRAVSSLMDHYAEYAVCVFAGLILGTLPALIRAAGEKPRTGGSYAAFLLSFLFFFALFLYLQYGVRISIAPSFLWYVFSGAVWGMSIILPGLSSSSILLFLGLFEPIVDGARAMDFSVLIPLAIGGVGTLAGLSKLINLLYKRNFSIMSHVIIGVVAATTIPLIPIRFSGVGDFVMQLLLLLAGFGAAIAFDRLGKRLQG